MSERKEALLKQVDQKLKARYSEEDQKAWRVSSDAKPVEDKSGYMDAILLPNEKRGKMPLTKSKYLVKENPRLVQWEREVRKFLRKLSPSHAHRVSAVMIYEWATGINVAQLMKDGGSAVGDLRNINKLLKFYFGDPYMTYIAGKKVPRAYRVPSGTLITRRRPMTLTLWVEYTEGTLSHE